jgi:hypothetical protein
VSFYSELGRADLSPDFRPGTVVDWPSSKKIDASLNEVTDDEIDVFIGACQKSPGDWLWYLDGKGRLRCDRWGQCPDARRVVLS